MYSLPAYHCRILYHLLASLPDNGASKLSLVSGKTGNDPQQTGQDVRNHEQSLEYYAEKDRQCLSAGMRVADKESIEKGMRRATDMDDEEVITAQREERVSFPSARKKTNNKLGAGAQSVVYPSVYLLTVKKKSRQIVEKRGRKTYRG